MGGARLVWAEHEKTGTDEGAEKVEGGAGVGVAKLEWACRGSCGRGLGTGRGWEGNGSGGEVRSLVPAPVWAGHGPDPAGGGFHSPPAAAAALC